MTPIVMNTHAYAVSDPTVAVIYVPSVVGAITPTVLIIHASVAKRRYAPARIVIVTTIAPTIAIVEH